ncbi:hypothetical protein DXG01_005904 [Tephrocybe rancida]|nr:hypothetical protein DXG01_005904 [Tephrocybe rancida]
MLVKDNFCVLRSDDTGNTHRGRKDTNEVVLTILNLSDCIHFLQNTSKDISRLPGYQDFIGKMKKMITFFSKSNYSVADLDKSRKDAGISKGLSKNIELIRDRVRSGKLQPKDKDVLNTLKNVGTYARFRSDMHEYMAILDPIARSLWALESPHTNAALCKE